MSVGACSTMAAVKALLAAPVATPCRTRAAMTQLMFGASANITIAASSSASPKFPLSAGS